MDEDRGFLPCRAYLLFASHSLERERGERQSFERTRLEAGDIGDRAIASIVYGGKHNTEYTRTRKGRMFRIGLMVLAQYRRPKVDKHDFLLG